MGHTVLDLLFIPPSFQNHFKRFLITQTENLDNLIPQSCIEKSKKLVGKGFEEIFDHHYIKPRRKIKLGNYRMVVGFLMLLFIGFNRLWHFTYIRLDAMISGFFQLTRLPVASTFWSYVNRLGINQANSFLKIMAVLRERVWQLCGLTFEKSSLLLL